MNRIQLGDINPVPSNLQKEHIARTLVLVSNHWNSPESPDKAQTVVILKSILAQLEGE